MKGQVNSNRFLAVLGIGKMLEINIIYFSLTFQSKATTIGRKMLTLLICNVKSQLPIDSK